MEPRPHAKGRSQTRPPNWHEAGYLWKEAQEKWSEMAKRQQDPGNSLGEAVGSEAIEAAAVSLTAKSPVPGI